LPAEREFVQFMERVVEMRINTKTMFVAAVLSLAVAAPAIADQSMVGTWKWGDYTVECKEGGDHGMSCTVMGGPKNMGMEMIRSALAKDGESFSGQIAHPATAEIYNTKMMMKDADTWTLDGCTDAGVCAKGVFVRLK